MPVVYNFLLYCPVNVYTMFGFGNLKILVMFVLFVRECNFNS